MNRIVAMLPRAFALVLAVLGIALAVRLVEQRVFERSDEIDPEEPVSASFVAESYSCARGETRTVLRGGVEDGYATDNAEPARQDRASTRRVSGGGIRGYDEMGLDRDFFDYFEPPRDIVSGLLVVRMAEQGEAANDSIIVGDFAGSLTMRPTEGQPTFTTTISSLHSDPDWTVSGDLFSVELSDLTFHDGRSLIGHINDPQTDGIVDVVVVDDTAVDFIALVTCSPPEPGTGMTFWTEPVVIGSEPVEGIIGASCYPLDRDFCDPFVGDTPCSEALPLACFRPADHDVPAEFSGPMTAHMTRYWTRGDLRMTPAIRGDSFDTLEDANAYCRQAFGDDWRVADFHLGGNGFVIYANSPDTYAGQVWLDIRDQPYATCWSRE